MLPPNYTYQAKITQKSKRLKDGRTHPWRGQGPSSKQARDINTKADITIPNHAAMGIRK